MMNQECDRTQLASREYWVVQELLQGKEVYYLDTQPTICGSEYKRKTWKDKRGLDIDVRIVTFEEDWKNCGYWIKLKNQTD